MKAVWLITAAVSLQACYSSKQSVQVAVMDAELVRIDTLFRYRAPVKVLTWRSADQVEYISYAGLGEPFSIGARMPVLMRR